MPKILRKIEQHYHRAPMFTKVFPLIESIFRHPDLNLFGYVFNAIRETKAYLGLDTDLLVSSELSVNHDLKNKWRIFEIYKHLEANEYINLSGGKEIYDPADFNRHGVNLKFMKHHFRPYPQLGNTFTPHLSIIDVMMFNTLEAMHEMLDDYELE